MNNKELVIEAVAVLMGKYSNVRKQAAELILRALISNEAANAILMDIAEMKVRDDMRSK